MHMYRICALGKQSGNYYDEYCEAPTARHAVRRVKEWHEGEDLEILEVAYVLKKW